MTQKTKIGKVGCKFCQLEFFLPETFGNTYVSHLLRVHKEKVVELSNQIDEEIQRVINLPK